MSERRTFSLSQVTSIIEDRVEKMFPSAFWVKAEMNKLNHNGFSGHAYPELVEKVNGKVVSEMRATMFRSVYQKSNAQFEQILNQPLQDGINVLLLVKIKFSSIYGMSLNVLDIDPSFTLGELEKEKLQTIQRLKKEGIFESNKKLEYPVLMQRLAVITAESSKGYSDFKSVLLENASGYDFYLHVFPATMQGDAAPPSILKQLERIKKVLIHFDAVVIIRGGGGEVGMTCYNDYHLSKEVALFPVPIFSGIGHSTNLTVVEQVSSQHGITPTQTAQYFINHLAEVEKPLVSAYEIIRDEIPSIIEEQKVRISIAAREVRSITRMRVSQETHEYLKKRYKLKESISEFVTSLSFKQNQLTQNLTNALTSKIHNQVSNQLTLLQNLKFSIDAYTKNKVQDLQNKQELIRLMDPQNILKRGYSISMLNGRLIRASDEVQSGDEVTTTTYKGTFKSTVQ